MTVPSFIDRVDNLLGRAEALTAGHHAARHLAMARERLNDPLRIAIAGRVKAGKSTLLNALIGERLAPTDASECTQVVTWYRKGSHYEAKTFLTDGTTRRLRFEREQSRLEIHLDDMHPDDLDRIEVEWPSRRLDDLVLIDTPGLESTRVAAGDRTLRFFGMDQDTPGQADAVVYLLRHMHRSDADFLESFLDRSMAQPSPFNAVAVLSRADELGAGRLDAMTSAQTIAKRYAEDRRVRVLCSGIVPVAGLLAETGVTLREDEVAALRVVAACDQEELQSILLSADRFRDPALTELPSGIRYRLLERFGINNYLSYLLFGSGISGLV